MTQQDLFRPMARPHHAHRMVDTSITAYREIAPSLSARQQAVLTAIRSFSSPPTAGEVAERMKQRGQIVDRNGMAPRATELCDEGVLMKGAKRPCRITGRSAYTLVVIGEER
jgi:hypothetical protein